MKFFVPIFFFFCISAEIISQEIDSLYVKPYPHKLWLSVSTGNKSVVLRSNGDSFQPNSPMNIGAKVGIRQWNVIIAGAVNMYRFRGEEFGRTRVVDLQTHKYWRSAFIDAYYQEYTSFFTQDKRDGIEVFPSLSVKQMGVEGTYIFNKKRFSSRASFLQSERQILSAGSFLLGGGTYWHRVTPDDKQTDYQQAFENYQAGVSLGYAYSWAAGKRWLITGILESGAYFGNEKQALKNRNIRVYPKSLVRMSYNYIHDNWSISLSGLFSNKTLYPSEGKPLRSSTINTQLTYTHQLDFLLKRKK